MQQILAKSEAIDQITNHQNLISFFDSLAVFPDLEVTTLRNTLKSVVCVSPYTYTSVYMKIIDNVWADILGR